MAAPTGNTNALKWTLERTIDTLQDIQNYAEEERIHTLAKALSLCQVHQGIWTYWKKRWVNNYEVMDLMYGIDQLFIAKLKEGMLTKRLHPGSCMFILRTNYGYNDKKEMEETMPPYLAAQLAEELAAEAAIAEAAKEEARRAAGIPKPLPEYALRFPHIYRNTPPTDGSRYTKLGEDFYALVGPPYTDEELDKVGVYPPPGSAMATGYFK